MKTRIFKINIFVLSLILAIVCLCPIFSNKVAFAEQQNEKKTYALVPVDYNKDGLALSKYNIEPGRNLEPFQPFDLKTKQRMSGYSFHLNEEDNYKILNQYVKVDEQENISASENLSLFMWIYFDNIYVHDLTITLEFEDGATLVWNIPAEKIYEWVVTSDVGINVVPYAWNLFELSYASATKSGEIKNDNYYKQVKKVYFNYTSEVEIEKMSRIMIYNVYLEETSSEYKVIKESQPYRFGDAEIFSKEVLSDLCTGDSLTIPSPTAIIKYAWVGTTNIKTSSLVTKQIVLLHPTEGTKNVSYGEKLNLDVEGEYKLIYHYYNTLVEDSVPLISFEVKMDVEALRGIYFGKKQQTIKVGKVYTYSINASDKLTNFEDYNFTSSKDGLVCTYIGNGIVEVYATEKGDYTLSASVNATRLNSSEIKEYTTSIKFEVVDGEKDKTTLKIVLYCVLGVLVVTLGTYGVISLVKANKYKVK